MASAQQRAKLTTTGLPVSELLTAQRGRLPVEISLGIVLELARLLDRAHQKGNVHGALSPHAVWVSCSGDVWIEWHPQRSPVHRSLPPEVRQGEEPGGAADIYALGAVAYELLTGLSISRAWAKAPLVNLQDIASTRQFNPAVPKTVDEIISLSLARHPADRPARISTLALTVETALKPGQWESSLATMLSDPFFSPALRDLPVTCERAAAPLPPALAEQPPALASAAAPVDPTEPAPLPPPARPRPVVVLAAANDDDEQPSSTPFVKIMIVTVLAAAASLALCLGASRLGADPGGRALHASKMLVAAPKVAAVVPEPAPAPAAVVASAAIEPAPHAKAKVKVKADRHPSKRHAAKSKRKSR